MDKDTVARAVELAQSDGEIILTAANIVATLVIESADDTFTVGIDNGKFAGPLEASAHNDDQNHTTIGGDASTWDKLMMSIPPAPFNDLFAAANSNFVSIAPEIVHAPLHATVRRFIELLRHAMNGTDPSPRALPNVSRHGEHEHTTGHYIHLDLRGLDHRIYYEEAGSGIGLLCQHTAGADGRQWRHILEDENVTSKYRVIVYDMPYHARSLPPEGTAWWAEEYSLTTKTAMELPVALSDALRLERPVFIGSSVGGMLALDLARYHADDFRAVIALEGGLRATGGLTAESAEKSAQSTAKRRLFDPALHGATMMRIMSPTAPETYRHESALHYAQGAPGVFTGDLSYHAGDHDLRGEAERIDTDKCAVYLLTGEYDFTMIPVSERAAREIKGARYQLMEGLGHFPMSEDYEQLMGYVQPILDEIAAT